MLHKKNSCIIPFPADTVRFATLVILMTVFRGAEGLVTTSAATRRVCEKVAGGRSEAKTTG
jgi:hypothetical protein